MRIIDFHADVYIYVYIYIDICCMFDLASVCFWGWIVPVGLDSPCGAPVGPLWGWIAPVDC